MKKFAVGFLLAATLGLVACGNNNGNSATKTKSSR